MRDLRELCPPGTVYQQDTDGMWVHPSAGEALRDAGVNFGTRAGQIREVCREEAARFFGPRHYWIPGQWVLSGMSDFVVGADGQSVTDHYSANPLFRPDGSAPLQIRRVTRTNFIGMQPDPGQVDGFGWLHPKELD